MPLPILALTQEANAETRMRALGPSYQFRADTVTLSGGNVATIPNRLGTDSLVLTAGTLAAPSSDLLFAGHPSIVFNGTQWLDSNLPSSSWKFLHDGTGFEVFLINSHSNSSVISTVLATRSVNIGTLMRRNSGGTGNLNVLIRNALAQNVVSANSGTPLPINTASIYNLFYSSIEPINYGLFQNNVLGPSGAQGVTPTPNNPDVPLRLGADGTAGGGNPFFGNFCELLIFTRPLHEYERQIVREYIQARYGIVAPVLSGLDREIMSLRPFNWIDSTSAIPASGLITSFADKALPGHSFLQASSGNQVGQPTPDASFNGYGSVAFTNTQFYNSTLALSSWRLGHDGTGISIYQPFVPTSDAVNSVMFNTRGGVGVSLYRLMNTNINSFTGTTAGATLYNLNAGSVPINVASCLSYYHSSSVTPNASVKVSGNAANTNTGGTPNTGDPVMVMRWGNNGGASYRSPGFLIFNRALSSGDLATLQRIFVQRFNLTI